METRCILLREELIITENLRYYYWNNGIDAGIPVYPIKYVKGKFSSAEAKICLDTLLPDLHRLGVTTILVCDARYFNLLTKSKAEYSFGRKFECKYKHFKFEIIAGINYKMLAYNPEIWEKFKLSIDIFNNKSHTYCNLKRYRVDNVRNSLDLLLNYPRVACDIETTGLTFYSDSLYSIGFSWSAEEGIAFLTAGHEADLKYFFDNYKGELVFHNSSFDIKFLIYKLYMKNIDDQQGLLTGLHTLCRNFNDTKLIAYLALNSTRAPSYSLKDLAFPYTGKYALDDIKDVTKVPVDKLLDYNVTDTCATIWVYDNYMPRVEKDNQKELLYSLFLPTQKVLIQTELTGVRLNPEKVKVFKHKVESVINTCTSALVQKSAVQQAEQELAQMALDKENAKLKTKVKTLDDIKFKFNPRSHAQINHLLFNTLHLPIKSYTDSGQPSSDSDTIAELLQEAQDPEIKDILTCLSELQNAAKIMSDFIPRMENAYHGRMFGNFVLGGTKSGRLSSNNPNMQNMPSTGSKYAKEFKACFDYADDWIMVGSDFNALEDHINALLTKDPNKLGVYLNGYDSHCLRSYYYYQDQMPDIVLAEEGDECFKETDSEGNTIYKCIKKDGRVITCK